MNNFYKNLFSEEGVDLEAQNWLLGQLSMSLDEQEQASCERLLTVEECCEALNGMDTGKSPMPGLLPRIISLSFRLLRTSKMCLLRFWGRPWW